MYVPGRGRGHQVNKFQQVSSIGRQMSGPCTGGGGSCGDTGGGAGVPVDMVRSNSSWVMITWTTPPPTLRGQADIHD